MPLFADPRYATSIVFNMVDSINRHMNETAYVIAPRAGTERRIAREKAQAKVMAPWHNSATEARKGLPKSRQVLRRMERMQQGSLLHQAKMRALTDKTIGGAAALS